MIIQDLSNGICSIISWMIAQLATGPWQPWNPDVSGVTSVFQQVQGLNANFPIDTAAVMFGIWLMLQVNTIGVFVIFKVYRLFRSGSA
jgi:hypothetical protein